MKKNARSYTGIVLAVTVVVAQLAGSWIAGAEDLQKYTGTTQISTSEVYPTIDTLTVELEVEEVYAEAGSQLSEGDQILKLTQESYQKALDYAE